MPAKTATQESLHSDVPVTYFETKSKVLNAQSFQMKADALRHYELEMYCDKEDILYLVTKFIFLYKEQRFANMSAYKERVSEVASTLNPNLDTDRYFKNFQATCYNNYIAGSAEECFSIAFSLCGIWPQKTLSSDSIEYLMVRLATATHLGCSLGEIGSCLLDIFSAYNPATEQTVRDISEVRYKLFC